MPRRRSHPRKSKSRKQVASPADDWYTIRSILDERLVSGRIEYLVDWDDNKTTGEAYLPTWSREVTDQAKDEWEKTKTFQNKGLINQDTQDTQDTQDSQSPRPSNWRKQQKRLVASSSIPKQPSECRSQISSSTDQSGRPCKIRKISYSATPSEEPVPSIVSPSSTDSAIESAGDVEDLDCLPQGDFDALRHQELVVELQKGSQFDPAEYSDHHRAQSSEKSSQSIAELEDQDKRLIFASRLSPHTIPDSQEQSGQTWSVNLPQAELDPSSLKSPEPQLDSRHPAPDLVQDDNQIGGFGSSCFETATGQPSDHSDDPEILSHQVDQGKSRSLVTQCCYPLTTPGNKPRPEARSPRGNTDSPTVPAASPSPVFLSQLPLPFSFDIPESSPGDLHASSTRSVVDETPSAGKQSSSRTPVTAEYLTESQDAQVLYMTPFVSHAEAFSESHDTSKEEDLAVKNVVSLPQGPETVSQPSPGILNGMMGDKKAGEPSNPAPPSAVDELRQILNLDGVMADLSSSHEQDNSIAASAEFSKVPSSASIVREPEAEESEYHSHQSGIAESQDGQAKSPNSPEISAVQSLQGIVDMILDGPDLPISSTITLDALQNPDVSTVSLAEISNQPALALMPPLLSQTEPFDEPAQTGLQSSTVAVPMGQPQPDEEPTDGSSDDSQGPISLKHIVTLPFQASLRPLYDDTLLEFKEEVTQFGAFFSSEEDDEPDQALVHKIDHVFNRLHNLCDYPPDTVGSVLENLPSDQLIKYCCDGNHKFNFLYELLQGLKKGTRILIVARSIDLLRLLYRLTETLNIECVCEDLDPPLKSECAGSLARVTLILPERNVDEDEFDVVIGYDYLFGSSEIGKKLEQEIPDARSPLVLILVTTHSIEHINLYVPGDLTVLERKNALISGIVRARQLVGDPDRGYPEPHELASRFLHYLNGGVESIVWEPVPVPEDVLDVYINSQTRSQMHVAGSADVENARKRKLDVSDDEDVKRMRMLPFKQPIFEANDIPAPDDVQMLLGAVKVEGDAAKSKGVVSVPMVVLQALAEQVSELRRQADMANKEPEYKSLIDGLQIRINEYERTSAKSYSSQRAALEDRVKFERQTQKAEAALQSATEAAQRDEEKARKKIADLEASVARLTSSEDNSEETPLYKTQKLLQEAQERTQMLEKRLENAHKDADYARSLYQDATTTNSALRGENSNLKEQVTDLRKKTEETLGKVHAIQADSAMKQQLHQIRDLKAQLREREIELDRTKDELRQLKNGRRETRQVSVPRSPRMGMMSPRTGRATYGGGGGGSASRGTSPAPTSAADGTASSVLAGMQFISQPPGNGRWNHLRD